MIRGARSHARVRLNHKVEVVGGGAHPVDAEEVLFGPEDLLCLLAELAVILDCGSLQTPLVPEQLGDFLELRVLLPALDL